MVEGPWPREKPISWIVRKNWESIREWTDLRPIVPNPKASAENVDFGLKLISVSADIVPKKGPTWPSN